MVRAEMRAAVNDRAKVMSEERILDLLLPPVRRRASLEVPADPEEGENDQQASRAKFRERLRTGQLDERMVELEVTAQDTPLMQVIGPMNLDEMGVNLQEMFGNILPKKTKKRKVTIAEARVLLTNEEAAKLIDHDAAVKEAIGRIESSGIVFIDEIDKIAGSRGQAGGPDVSREGVQRDLLPIVEGSAVTTKYGAVRTDHILFIAAGAFHVSKPSDLIPEMQGRFPIRVELDSLTEEDFVRILTIPENALLKQYTAMLATEGVVLDFREDGIREIARTAWEVNAAVENIGARRLHTILTTLLDEILFEAPDAKPDGPVVVDRQLVDQRLAAVVKNRDLSRYIL
jgi:ATP-dependent HslUV protease ATP-binding subunit HslU